MKGPRRTAPYLYDDECQDRHATRAGGGYWRALGQLALGGSTASDVDLGGIAGPGRRPSQDQTPLHNQAPLRDQASAPAHGGYSG